LCPAGFSPDDYWSLGSNDCHADDSFLRLMHTISFLMFLFSILLAMVGMLMAFTKDFAHYSASENQKMGRKTTKKSGRKSSSTNSASKVVPSGGSETDVKESLPPAATTMSLSMVLAMWRTRRYFRLFKLFSLHFAFSVGGAVYLGMSLAGHRRYEKNVLMDAAVWLAAATLFAGLWEVRAAAPTCLPAICASERMCDRGFVRAMILRVSTCASEHMCEREYERAHARASTCASEHMCEQGY
jgi:hypothetical protein